MFRTWALGLSMALCASQAFAWLASAGNGEGSHLILNSASREQAGKEAMEACSARMSNCTLDLTGNATAFVLAKGAGGYATATNPDPLRAAETALKDCRSRYQNCRLMQAGWDHGAPWGGLALSESYIYFSLGNGSQQETERNALEGCRKSATDPEKCRIHEAFTSTGPTFYAVAASPQYKGLGLSSNADKAKKNALEACEEGKPAGDGPCRVEKVYPNTGREEPPTMKKVLAEIERSSRPAAAAPSGAGKRTASTTRSTQVLRCSNVCHNGDCVRTFENGRKERWQAPRKYDPFTRNWGWDTTTNACGA